MFADRYLSLIEQAQNQIFSPLEVNPTRDFIIKLEVKVQVCQLPEFSSLK